MNFLYFSQKLFLLKFSVRDLAWLLLHLFLNILFFDAIVDRAFKKKMFFISMWLIQIITVGFFILTLSCDLV